MIDWIHACGGVGAIFVGVPHIEYLLQSMPKSFIYAGMKPCCAVGDATDFMTETTRSPFMKKVRNMQHSDKMKHSCARGTTFCSGNRMTIMALPLVFGHSSEMSCVRACASMLAMLPPWVLGLGSLQ